MVICTFKLPEDVKEQAKAEAARLSQQRGVTVLLSDVFRMALKEWLENQAKRKKHWKANGNR